MGLCELRDRMLGEHGLIERRLDEIEDLARQVACGESGGASLLHLRAIELLDTLEVRVRWEERHLLPAIRDSYGAERAAQAREELSVQRELLRYQLDGLTKHRRPPALVAFGMRDFARLMRDEIDEEEHLFFDPSDRATNVFVDAETA